MPLVQTSPPAVEPVLLTDVKLNSRIIDAVDDSLLSLLISAARLYAESYTNRSFITQSWKLVLDAFPGPGQMGTPYGVPFSLPGHAILLEKGNIQSITSITYTAMDGTIKTMPMTDYIADLSGNPARITPLFGKIWPVTLPQIASVNVNYVAGYGNDGTFVPAGIKQWIQLRVATMYENREEVAILSRGKVEALPFVDGLLDPYCVPML